MKTLLAIIARIMSVAALIVMVFALATFADGSPWVALTIPLSFVFLAASFWAYIKLDLMS